MVTLSRHLPGRHRLRPDAAYWAGHFAGHHWGLHPCSELSKLNDNEHPAKALEAYESFFRPFVEESQQIPSFVPGIAHPETAWKRWLFQATVSTISKIVAIPWVATKFQGNSESRDDGFSLPKHPSFDEVCSK